jgi:ribonuclease BN (tRNA processing enzyme)
MVSLEFLGVGSATDFSLGQTSVLYRGRGTLLVDCGPQIPAAFVQRLADPEALDGIFITHRHADHCFGLGSLLLWHRLHGRQRALKLFGAKETLEHLRTLLELGYPGAFSPEKCFPLDYESLVEEATFEAFGCGLSVAPTDHNVHNFALRIDDGRTRIAVSGDGVLTPQTLRLYAGCDLVVQECAYAEREHAHHMNLSRVRAMIEVVQPKTTLLTHCLTEQRPLVEAAVALEGSRLRVACSSEGVSLSD